MNLLDDGIDLGFGVDRAMDAHCCTDHRRQTTSSGAAVQVSTVLEVSGSHAAYVSKREAVAAFIEQAAKDVKLPAK